MRAGAAKPDISTPEPLKATLLKAQSVASIPASAIGYSIAKVVDRLGITEAMTAKMKAQPTPAEVVAVVAKGEADLALFLMNVLIAPGLGAADHRSRIIRKHARHRCEVADAPVDDAKEADDRLLVGSDAGVIAHRRRLRPE